MSAKYKILGLFLGLLGMAQTTAYAFADTFTTGKDWVEKMSPREKFISLFVPTTLFQRYNVPLRHSAAEYISTIDQILFHNPHLEKEDVANIFAAAVYKYEPDCRPALESMELQFLRGNTRALPPYLAIQSGTES